LKIIRKDVSISPPPQDMTNFEGSRITKVDKPFFKVVALHIEPEKTRECFGQSYAIWGQICQRICQTGNAGLRFGPLFGFVTVRRFLLRLTLASSGLSGTAPFSRMTGSFRRVHRYHLGDGG
jgi:hypothetical protein